MLELINSLLISFVVKNPITWKLLQKNIMIFKDINMYFSIKIQKEITDSKWNLKCFIVDIVQISSKKACIWLSIK